MSTQLPSELEKYIPVLEYVNWFAQQPGKHVGYTMGDFTRLGLEYCRLPQPPFEIEKRLTLAVMRVVMNPPFPAGRKPERLADPNAKPEKPQHVKLTSVKTLRVLVTPPPS